MTAGRVPRKPRGAPSAGAVRHGISLLTADDLYLFNEGSHVRLYEKLGCHLRSDDGQAGTYFAVWAPDAAVRIGHRRLQRLGQGRAIPCAARENSGIWEGFIPGVGKGAVYKYHIASRYIGYRADKADPFAVYAEMPPRTASVVWDLDYDWGDEAWMAAAAARIALNAPISDLRGPPRLLAARAGGGPPLADLPRDGAAAGRVREVTGLHPRRVPAGDGAPLLRLLGLPDHRLLRPDQPLRHAAGFHVPGRLPAPARHRRDPGLGALALSQPTSTASATSTARTSTSTPIRGRAFIRTGTAASSTTAATRCAASCSAAPSSGSTSITPTACASTPWPRCSTSTTRARRASGSPTSTAAARTWRPSTSCAASTRRSTSITPTSRPSPRSRPPGRWSRGQPTSAASASASSGTWAGCTTPWTTSRNDPIHRKYHHNELTFRMHLRLHRELRAAAFAR